MTRARALALGLAGALVGAALLFRFAPRAEVLGVDVSAHQGAIDWRALSGADIRFAYIKASEGASHRDARFAANWRDAARAGLKRGAYHFFTLCQPGAAQAHAFIATVPYTENALPAAVDLEHLGPCRRGPEIADAPHEIAVFLDLVEQRYGVRPLLYTTRAFHDRFLQGAFAGERFWIRSLHARPSFRRDSWVIWQRDDAARLPGVQGPVDLNSFRGDARAFTAFAASARKSRPDGAPDEPDS